MKKINNLQYNIEFEKNNKIHSEKILNSSILSTKFKNDINLKKVDNSIYEIKTKIKKIQKELETNNKKLVQLESEKNKTESENNRKIKELELDKNFQLKLSSDKLSNLENEL